jgi:hypothetical protein
MSSTMSTATTYEADGSTLPNFDDVTDSGQSYQRRTLENLEVQSGGNGLTGHDETTEDTSITWGTAASFAAPTPGVVPFL